MKVQPRSLAQRAAAAAWALACVCAGRATLLALGISQAAIAAESWTRKRRDGAFPRLGGQTAAVAASEASPEPRELTADQRNAVAALAARLCGLVWYRESVEATEIPPSIRDQYGRWYRDLEALALSLLAAPSDGGTKRPR